MRNKNSIAFGIFALTFVPSTEGLALQEDQVEVQEASPPGASLKDRGLSFAGSYTLDWSRIASGGLHRRDTARGLVDLTIELDLEKLFGLEGGTFFAEYYTKTGRNGSDDVGDIQGFSNIDGDDIRHSTQVWFEQWLFADAVRVKVGKVDANTDFAFVNSATDLLNSSAGYSPTILGMPTYPDPAWSANAFFYPSERAHVGLGLYDGTLGKCPHGDPAETGAVSESPSSLFWIAELGFAWPDSEKWRAGRMAIGPWYRSGAVERFDGGRTSRALGFYTVFEQKIWNAPEADEEQGLNLFLQYGYGDEAVCEISHHFSVGLVSRATLPGRDEDAAGIMVSFVSLSKDDGAQIDGNETVWEFFYRLQLSRFIGITSDIQYILQPSGLSSVGRTLVATFRFEFSFSSEDL